MNDAAHAHQPHTGTYLAVFGALLVLTVVTVLVSYWHLPPGPAVAVGLAIATLKASLVGAFFMHLKGERAIIYTFLGLTVFFTIVLFTVPLTDRHALSDRTAHTPVAMDGAHEAHPAHEGR